MRSNRLENQLITRLFCVLAVITIFSGCAQQPAKTVDVRTTEVVVDEDDAAENDVSSTGRPSATEDSQPVLPLQELTDTILYEYLLAEIAGQRGNVGLSAQAYLDLAKRTRDPRIARRATEIAIFARMNNFALEAARIWYQTDPRSQRAVQVLTGLLLGAGQLEEAYPHLRSLLAAPGASPADIFLQLARSLANVKDKSASLDLMQKLAAGHANLPQAHYAVAQAALAADREEVALDEIRKAQAIRPDWEPAVLFEAQMLQKKSNADALSRLARYLERYPNSREIRLNYARALVTEQRIADARTEFQKLLTDFPTNVDVIYSVALLALQSNELSVAEANLKRLLELDFRDKNTVRMYLGQIAEDQGRLPDALRWYAEVGGGEQFFSAQIRYAQIMAKQGNLAKGREHLQQLAAKSPAQRVPLVLAEAQMLRDASEIDQAFQLLGKALEAQPDNPELLYDYGMLAERIDRMDILESSIRKVIAARPDYAHAYNALGYSFADRNTRLAEARELIEKALKLAPRDHFIIDSMGWVLYRLGEYAEALKYLRQAYASRPDAEIAAHLGEVLWVMGLKAEAESIWKEATQKFPKNEILTKTMQRFLGR